MFGPSYHKWTVPISVQDEDSQWQGQSFTGEIVKRNDP